MKRFGLIGFPLSHSFSKKYFTNKYEQEGILDCKYELFPLESIDQFPDLLKSHPDLVGLNVTIPYKEQVLKYLDEVDAGAAQIGAVNTIKISKGRLKGYNTDVYGFEQSIRQFVLKNGIDNIENALILGTGGASKAIEYVLEKMEIEYTLVSRNVKKGVICYHDLNASVISNIQLIVNTTPLGMSPNEHSYPELPYSSLNEKHLLFDLVYNPEKTVFLRKGEEQGAYILNGHEMLIGQAEKSWEIWTNKNTN